MNVYDKMHELATALQNSEQYLKLLEAKEKVDSDPEQKKMLDDYLLKQFEIQKAHLFGLDIEDESLEELNKIHQLVMLRPAIQEYLNAQYNFAQLWSDIQKVMGDAVRDVFDLPQGVVH